VPDTLVQGKALYVGILVLPAERTVGEGRRPVTRHAARHPPARLLDPQRWVEDGLTECCVKGMGRHRLHPLAQGLLTDKYLGDGTGRPGPAALFAGPSAS
jgi:L-glyceraldehyde 3-phosphate reductase